MTTHLLRHPAHDDVPVLTEEELNEAMPIDSRDAAPIENRFTLLNELELDELPDPEWVIDGVLPSNALAVLVAPPKSYKSFLVLDWAMCIATGLDWHGRHVKKGECIYVYSEGTNSLQPRVKAWQTFNRVAGTNGVFFLPRRVMMNEQSDVDAFIDSVLSRSRDPQLVIIDTLARNMAGDENSTEQMNAFVRGCDFVREETGATVLVVHHTGHAADGRGRGSSVLPAAADTLMQVSKDADRVQLECKFQKDAPDFPHLALQAVPVGSSMALQPIGVSAGGLTGNRAVTLSALHSTGGQATTYSAWKKISGLENKGSSFETARKWLLDNAYVNAAAGSKYVITESGRQALRAINQ